MLPCIHGLYIVYLLPQHIYFVAGVVCKVLLALCLFCNYGNITHFYFVTSFLPTPYTIFQGLQSKALPSCSLTEWVLVMVLQCCVIGKGRHEGCAVDTRADCPNITLRLVSWVERGGASIHCDLALMLCSAHTLMRMTHVVLSVFSLIRVCMHMSPVSTSTHTIADKVPRPLI